MPVIGYLKHALHLKMTLLKRADCNPAQRDDSCVMGGEVSMRWRDGLLSRDLMGSERRPVMVNTMTERTPMTLSDRIRQLRKEHGLTQEDLAAKAGRGIATIQRVERGERPSADTIASIASAFNLSAADLTSASKPMSAEPTEGSYLPLTEITSGKRLVDLMATCSAIDFDYMDIQDATLGDLLGRLYEFCRPRDDFQVPANPSDRIRLDIDAARLLTELKGKGLTLTGETYERTGHEIDEGDGDGIPFLMAKWDETCLVLRVGTSGLIIDRADVQAHMPKWYNTSDTRVVRVKTPEMPADDDEIPF
jgi:transcriptional regulator with XRE-family HTH domain